MLVDCAEKREQKNAVIGICAEAMAELERLSSSVHTETDIDRPASWVTPARAEFPGRANVRSGAVHEHNVGKRNAFKEEKMSR